MNKNNLKQEELLLLSGTDISKCMKCGKCSASCPSYDENDLLPHHFISYLSNGKIIDMMDSNTLWRCLSCFTCTERCPRGVDPAKVIEAVRLIVIRQQGSRTVSPDDIPGLTDPQMPQQLLVSIFRKF